MLHLAVWHDLGAVAHNAGRIAVMKGGEAIEEGITAPALDNPQRDRKAYLA